MKESNKWAQETDEDAVENCEGHPSGSDNSNYNHNKTTDECNSSVAKQTKQDFDIWGVADTNNTIDGLEWDAKCGRNYTYRPP